MKSYFAFWFCCGFWLCLNACDHNSTVVNMILDASGSKTNGAQVSFLNKKYNISCNECFEECCKMNVKEHCNMANFITEKSTKIMKITEASVRGNCTLISCVPFSSCILMQSVPSCHTIILNTTIAIENTKKEEKDMANALRDVLTAIKLKETPRPVENVTVKDEQFDNQAEMSDNNTLSSSEETSSISTEVPQKDLSRTMPRKGVEDHLGETFSTNEEEYSQTPTVILSGSKPRKGVTNTLSKPSMAASSDSTTELPAAANNTEQYSIKSITGKDMQSSMAASSNGTTKLSKVANNTANSTNNTEQYSIKSTSGKGMPSSTAASSNSTTKLPKVANNTANTEQYSTTGKDIQSSTIGTVIDVTDSTLVTETTLTSESSTLLPTGSTNSTAHPSEITNMSSKKVSVFSKPSSSKSFIENDMIYSKSDKHVTVPMKSHSTLSKLEKHTHPNPAYHNSKAKPIIDMAQKEVSKSEDEPLQKPMPVSPDDLSESKAPAEYIIVSAAFGVLVFVIMVVLISRAAWESYQKRHYRRMDFLVDGMYD